jgi:hypothetical protein
MEEMIKEVIMHCSEKERNADVWIKLYQLNEDITKAGAWCVEKIAYRDIRKRLEKIIKKNSPCRKAATSQRIAT